LEEKKIAFEFNADNFICDGKAIKWADIRKIYLGEIDSSSMNNFVYLTVNYEQITEDKVKKEEYIARGSLFKNPEEVLKLVADKFNQYYGVLHGVTLKKQFPSGEYELKPDSHEIAAIEGRDQTIV